MEEMESEVTRKPYVYVFIRRDLSVPQQAVQAGHAVLEMARTAWEHTQEHPSLIYLSVRDEKELKKVMADLTLKTTISFTPFREPDIGHQFTAIATEPIYGEDRIYFKKFQLMDGHSHVKKG